MVEFSLAKLLGRNRRDDQTPEAEFIYPKPTGVINRELSDGDVDYLEKSNQMRRRVSEAANAHEAFGKTYQSLVEMANNTADVVTFIDALVDRLNQSLQIVSNPDNQTGEVDQNTVQKILETIAQKTDLDDLNPNLVDSLARLGILLKKIFKNGGKPIDLFPPALLVKVWEVEPRDLPVHWQDIFREFRRLYNEDYTTARNVTDVPDRETVVTPVEKKFSTDDLIFRQLMSNIIRFTDMNGRIITGEQGADNKKRYLFSIIKGFINQLQPLESKYKKFVYQEIEDAVLEQIFNTCLEVSALTTENAGFSQNNLDAVQALLILDEISQQTDKPLLTPDRKLQLNDKLLQKMRELDKLRQGPAHLPYKLHTINLEVCRLFREAIPLLPPADAQDLLQFTGQSLILDEMRRDKFPSLDITYYFDLIDRNPEAIDLLRVTTQIEGILSRTRGYWKPEPIESLTNIVNISKIIDRICEKNPKEAGECRNLLEKARTKIKLFLLANPTLGLRSGETADQRTQERRELLRQTDPYVFFRDLSTLDLTLVA